MDWTAVLKQEINFYATYTSQVDSPLASPGNSSSDSTISDQTTSDNTISDSTTTSDNTDNSDEELAAKISDEENEFIQQIEEMSFKNEKISRKLAHGMFVGPTGAGKTSLMDRLLGRKRKKFIPSTGVADPVVAVNVTLHAVTVSEGNTWKEVEYDESIVKQMGKESSTTAPQHSTPHETTATDDTGSSSDATPDVPIVLPYLKATKTLTSKVKTVMMRKKFDSSTKEMIHHIVNRCGSFKEFKELLENISLYLRDTGGQVEFQEMLPLLISGPSIFFFVFRLDLDFKSKFTVKYRKSTGESLNCYTSSITTEEAFLQFLASVYAMDTSGDTSGEVRVKTHEPLVFVVGTHKDMLGELANKKIAELNEYLDHLIKKSGFQDVVQYADRRKGHVMFTVDNTSDSNEDFKIIQSNVSNLIRGRDEFTIEFPIRYLLFSLELQNVQHGILSLEKVGSIAAECGIIGDELLPLLQFLHLRMGIIRYYDKDGVRHIVIREPQLLFNAVTSLIMKTFSCEAMTTAEADNLEKKGILAAPTLARVSKSEGLTSEEFLRLLVHLRLTAPFTSKGDQDQENRYFFPSVLNHVQESSEGDLYHTDILPLAIRFECKHVPKGLFGVLVTHLMNPDLEEGATSNTTTFTLMQDKIFRDQVSFEVHSPGVQDEMALKAIFSHMEIKFYPEHSKNRDTSITEVCSNVRQILETSIQQSLEDLHYSKIRVAPEMCLRCDDCSELHVVKKGKKIYCKKTRTTKDISSQAECWFSEASSPVLWLRDKHYEQQQIPIHMEVLTGNIAEQHSTNTKLRGVDELKETEVLIDNSPQQFQWQGYGLKLNILPQSLPRNVSSCTITIRASLSGQYQFPPDTHLVSPVFWLQCDPPCKFSKQLTLEIQHCAPRENSSSLRMVRAVCTQKELPYSFKVLRGSSFSENSAYGLVPLNQFSGIAVTGPDERCYWSSVFYMGPPKNRHIHFTVTWDDELHLTIMNEQYKQKKADLGPAQPIAFKETYISLKISDDGLDLGDQWRVYPTIPPKISKKVVDDHQTRNMRAVVPHCELVARWMKSDQQMQSLEHRVDILGASEETYFRISIYEDPAAEIPTITATTSPPTHVEVKRLLKSLTPDQMRDVGVELGLHYPNLKKMDDKSLLNEMINSWLMEDDDVQKISGTPAGRAWLKHWRRLDALGWQEKLRKTNYKW